MASQLSIALCTMAHLAVLACYFYWCFIYKFEVVPQLKAFRANQMRRQGLEPPKLEDSSLSDLKFLTVWNLVGD